MNTSSVLTASGEQFLADIIQDRHERDGNYFITDLCEEWDLECIEHKHIKIPDEYDGYGAITATESPLLLKALFGLSNPTQIRTHPYNAYPRFFNEIFGEVCLWKEAVRRGKPHTELFAPVYRYDNENYEWAIVAYATDIQHRSRPATKRVEERARELGWAPDDTEVGLLDSRYVAIDYGYWWRRNDKWITAVNELPYVDSQSLDYCEECEPISDDLGGFEPLPDDARPPQTPPTPPASTDDRDATHVSSDDDSSAHRTDSSDSVKTRFQRWLSELFS